MSRPTTRLLLLLLGLGAVLLLAGPAPAACNPNAPPFAWNRCWSGTRLLLAFVVSPLFTWIVLFHVWPFPSLISARNRSAPWPRDALAQTLAWWWLVNAAVTLTLFAFVSEELRLPLWQFGTSYILVLLTEWFVPLLLIILCLAIGYALWRTLRHHAA
jgi:hypothetical protein